LGYSLLQLELAVAEIHNQDEARVEDLKQDENNQPILSDTLSSSVPQYDPISLWDWVLEACAAGRHFN
jgi:hypothetical protein